MSDPKSDGLEIDRTVFSQPQRDVRLEVGRINMSIKIVLGIWLSLMRLGFNGDLVYVAHKLSISDCANVKMCAT